MLKSDYEVLYNFLSQKVELLAKYDDISERLLIDDMDKIEHLLDVRNGFLLEFNKITPLIDQLVARQPKTEQAGLRSMLKYEGLDEADDKDLSEIKRILIEMKKYIDAINEKTKETTLRFDKYRHELLEGMQKLRKSKEVINFVGATSNTQLFRGKTFDAKQ